jgi:signal transduction histidine kinase
MNAAIQARTEFLVRYCVRPALRLYDKRFDVSTPARRGTRQAFICHEIRNPLNGCLGMAQLLHDTPLDSTQAEYVDSILQCSDLMAALINDVLDFRCARVRVSCALHEAN